VSIFTIILTIVIPGNAQSYELKVQSLNDIFRSGRRLAIDSGDTVWISTTSSNGSWVYKWSIANTNLIRTNLRSGYGSISAHGSIENDYIYADYGSSDIQYIQKSSNLVANLSLNPSLTLLGQILMKVDTDGSFVILEDSNGVTRVNRYSKTGSRMQTFGSRGSAVGQFGSTPTALALDSQSNILLADGTKNRIAVFNSSGSYTREIKDGTSSFAPVGIAVLPNGNIVISNSARGGVEVVSPSGTLLFSLAKDLPGVVDDVAVDSEGRIYVLHASLGVLRVYHIPPPPPPADTTAPTSTHTISNPEYKTWYTTTATAQITAKDEANGSGVAEIRYKVNNGQEVSVPKETTSVVFGGSTGQHKLEYWAIDKTGNIGEHHIVTITVDATPPVTTATVSPGKRYVSLNAIDSGSGVVSTVYAIDDGDVYDYDGTPIELDGGNHTVYFLSADNTNNSETMQVLTITGPSLVSLFATPNVVMGGNEFELVAKLSQPSGPEGASVFILWEDDSYDYIEVPAGSDTGSIFVQAPQTTGDVTVYAGGLIGDSYREGSVTITKKNLFVTLPTKEVMAGTKFVATLEWKSSQAPGTVTLASSSPNVVVPATIKFPQNIRKVRFTVQVLRTFQGTEDVTLSATMREQTDKVAFTAKAYQIVGGMFVPSEVGMGGTAEYQVFLNGPAPSSGLTIGYAYTGNVRVVKSVGQLRVPPGEWVGSAIVTTAPGVTGSVTFNTLEDSNGPSGSEDSGATLTVREPQMSGLTFTPSSVVGGANLTGIASLDGSFAQASSVVVECTNPAVQSYVYAKLSAGKTSTPVVIKTFAVGKPEAATIFARTSTGDPVSANVMILPVPVSSLKFAKTVIPQNSSTTLTIALAKAAAIDTIVELSVTDNGLINCPTTVTVPKGKSSAVVTITAKSVSVAKSTTILATTEGITFKSSVITITK
jgi:hypothetical protein